MSRSLNFSMLKTSSPNGLFRLRQKDSSLESQAAPMKLKAYWLNCKDWQARSS